MPFNGHRTTAIFAESKLKIARKGEFKVDNGNFFAAAACEKRHENVFFSFTAKKNCFSGQVRDARNVQWNVGGYVSN